MKIKDLPCYVASSPDCMPSARLYGGDLSVLTTLLEKLNDRIVANESAMAAIASDLCNLKATITNSIQVGRPVVNNDGCTVMAGNSIQSSGQRVDHSVDDQILTSSFVSTAQMDWATRASITSSPVKLSNRHAVLGDEDDDDRDGGLYRHLMKTLNMSNYIRIIFVT